MTSERDREQALRYCYSTKKKYQIKVHDAETGEEIGRTGWHMSLREVEKRARDFQAIVGERP